MSHGEPKLTQPFGEECCEAEIQVLRDSYSDYYFEYSPFNDLALQNERYLLVGRRGAGKTSLAHYFTFQKKLGNSRCVDVDEPRVYEKVLSTISKSAGETSDVASTRIVEIWNYLIWSLIFENYKDLDSVVKSACLLGTDSKQASRVIREILKKLLERFLSDEIGYLTDELEDFLLSKTVKEAKKRVLSNTKEAPVIVAIDSLERYAVQNEPMMRATAGLVESSSNFNSAHANQGIHVKTFISAEIFPYLAENEISNTAKFIRKPVYLYWRPKDLMRLISWRFNLYLQETGDHAHSDLPDSIDWNRWREVLMKGWEPYFGRYVTSHKDLQEKSFPYILRHTQLRPRQLIIICNHIASLAKKKGLFPNFPPQLIATGVHQQTRHLATEIINSYSRVYENVGNIVQALHGFPMLFKGNMLDRYASRTAGEWPSGDYSPFKFRQIIAELGIVGRVRSHEKKRGIIEADFQYAIEDRLMISELDTCVIHPMFYEKLHINTDQGLIIYPFPDHPDFLVYYKSEFDKF